MPQNIAPNSSHIDQWLRVLVSTKQQIGGSQDHLVCLHLLPILTDQSHISKVIFTLQKCKTCDMIWLLKDWFDAYILSHKLQSYCTASFATSKSQYCTFVFHGHLPRVASRSMQCWKSYHSKCTLTRFSCGTAWNACGNEARCQNLSHTLGIRSPFGCSWLKGFDASEGVKNLQNIAFNFQRHLAAS